MDGDNRFRLTKQTPFFVAVVLLLDLLKEGFELCAGLQLKVAHPSCMPQTRILELDQKHAFLQSINFVLLRQPLKIRHTQEIFPCLVNLKNHVNAASIHADLTDRVHFIAGAGSTILHEFIAQLLLVGKDVATCSVQPTLRTFRQTLGVHLLMTQGAINSLKLDRLLAQKAALVSLAGAVRAEPLLLFVAGLLQVYAGLVERARAGVANHELSLAETLVTQVIRNKADFQVV